MEFDVDNQILEDVKDAVQIDMADNGKVTPLMRAIINGLLMI